MKDYTYMIINDGKVPEVSSYILIFIYLYPHGLWMVGSPLQSSSPREKEKNGENSHKACMGTTQLWSFSLYL